MEESACHNSALLERIQTGDNSALDELVSANMGLVRSIALRFMGRGTEYEDLLQIGSIGLIRAARTFDFSFGTAFSTYAVPLIIGEIKRFLRDDGMIKVSRNLKKEGRQILKAQEEFSEKTGRAPSLSELAFLVNLSLEETSSALEACVPIASLSDKPEGEDFAIEDSLSDKNADTDSLLEKISLSSAVKSLSKAQQKIIYLRFERDLSQQKTGEILGLSQVKISREEKKILELLREKMT